MAKVIGNIKVRIRIDTSHWDRLRYASEVSPRDFPAAMRRVQELMNMSTDLASLAGRVKALSSTDA